MVFKVRTCTITADSLLFPKAHPSFCFRANGDGEIRTLDPLLARQVLSQLSYTPIIFPIPGAGLPFFRPPLLSSVFYPLRFTALRPSPVFFLSESGTHLLSHIVSNIVPSAAYVLTVVFGMGTGVSHKRIGTGIIANLPAGSLPYVLHRAHFPSACRQRPNSI